MSIRIEANKGDCIEVSASEVNGFGAQIYLFGDDDFKRTQKDFDSGERTALMEFTDMKSLMPDNRRWTTIIPSSGVWHVVYQPWQAVSVTVHHVNKTPENRR